MADLKPCPFCGGKSEIWNATSDIFVLQCQCCGTRIDRYGKKEKVIEAWNTRKPIEAVVAELEKLLGDTNFEKATQEVNESFYDGLAYAYGMAISIVRGKE
jgi:Lar family restriction alleviation protein